MKDRWKWYCRMEAFAELAMLGAMLPLVGAAFILLSPLALLGWVYVRVSKDPK